MFKERPLIPAGNLLTHRGIMDCRQVHQVYSVYLQGKLPPTQMEWVAKHIQDCPDCFLLDQNVRKAFIEELNPKENDRPPS